MTKLRPARVSGAPPAWFLPPPRLAEPRRRGDIRVLTWNVHKGLGGLDRTYAPWRITEVIRYHDPDVALLQEVADGVPRFRRDRQAQAWAAAAGFPYVAFHADVRLAGGRWGNAILSKFPIRDCVHLNLSFPLKKRRGAVFADLELGPRHRRLHVVNMHLGLSGVERRWQVRKLLRFPVLSRLHARSRVVIAGDTNDWAGALARRSGALRLAGFTTAWGRHHGSPRTFPSWAPVAALDRVFLAGPLACRHAHRSAHLLARRASDHLPVVVDLIVRDR